MKPILIIGAGFSGAVLARELAEGFQAKIIVVDARSHIAGNCYTQRDPSTEVMTHVYGPHIFHTSRQEVWDYARRFSAFGAFVNRVKATTPKGVFGLPINLLTINQFFGRRFSPAEAKEFIADLGDRSIGEPQNFEEQALKFLGRELYEAFFYGYTKKQWGCEPSELPASVLKRLPVRFDYNDNYYDSRFQGIPIDGYTAIVERILAHDGIEVLLNTAWDPAMADEFEHVIFTGSIDQYYQHRFGRLGYRTVYWDRLEIQGDYQGNALMNYPHISDPFTRKIEHKHFTPWEEHGRSVIYTEYSKETEETDSPYYPKRLSTDNAVLTSYLDMAKQETRVSFLGRLATYRYMDMHQVIGEALDFAPILGNAIQKGTRRPVFPSNAIREP